MGKLGSMFITIMVINVVFFVIQFSDPSLSIGPNPLSSIFTMSDNESPDLLHNTSLYKMQEKLDSEDATLLQKIDYSLSVWGMIKGFFALLLSFFFAPVSMMVALEVPIEIVIIVGVIWTLGYLLAIFTAIWRFDI